MVKSVVFIGGLDATTTEQDLIKYFQRFGTIAKAEIVRNKSTNSSKGFGFVKFRDEESLVEVLGEPKHIICGRNVDCQRAQDSKNKKKHKAELRDKRVFITFLPADTTNEMVVSHFSKFGSLRSAYVIKEPDTDECKGYGFALFKRVEDAIKATEERTQLINGKEAQVARFKTKKQLNIHSKEEPNHQEKSKSSKSQRKTSTFQKESFNLHSACDPELSPGPIRRTPFSFEPRKRNKLRVGIAISKHQLNQLEEHSMRSPNNHKINKSRDLRDQTHRIVRISYGAYYYQNEVPMLRYFGF